MRRLTLLFLLAGLVAAAPASAKEVLAVTACGPDRCVTSDDAEVVAALMNGGTPSVPRHKGGVVLLRASIGDGTRHEEITAFMSAWDPGQRMLIGEDGTFMRLPAERRRAIAELTRGLGTYHPSIVSRLPSAEIDLPVAEPAYAPPEPAAAPAPPVRETAGDTDWALLLVPAALALALAAVRLIRRRRPGRGAPRPATQ